jgi:cytochrome c553
VEDYVVMGMKPIEEEDFSYIEGLLDPEGKCYRGSQRYIHTINEKGMEEEVFVAEVQDICISCHGTDLEEGVGPALQHVSDTYTKEEIAAIIRYGRGTMPRGLVSAEVAEQIVEYLIEA